MANGRAKSGARMRTRIGLIGGGAIGSFLAKRLGGRVAWVCDVDGASARKRLRGLGLNTRVVRRPAKGVALVVECASQEAVPLLLKTLEYADAMILSVGALRNGKLLRQLEASARRHGHVLLVPSGAIGGLRAL